MKFQMRNPLVAGLVILIVGGLPRAVEASGALSSTNTVDSSPPTVPTKLTALTVTPRKVVLGWGASKDNSGAVTYTLQRDGALLKSGIPSTNYVDVQVQPGTTYAYQVQAVDPSTNKSAFTAPLNVTTSDEQLVDT